LVGCVDALKIEGRARGPEYAARAVSVYREALRRVAAGTFDEAFVEDGLRRLAEVFNRGFSNGLYFGRAGDDFVRRPGSQAERRKLTLGRVVNYYRRVGVAEISITDHRVGTGDILLIEGPTTGVVEQTVRSMEIDHVRVDHAGRGERVGVAMDEMVRRGDRVYLWAQRGVVDQATGRAYNARR
jgi:putative protease